MRVLQMTILKMLLLTIVCLFPVISASAAMTSCRISYNLKGWSVFYKQYKGSGVVRCENGQRRNVSLITRGGGITLGKSEINKGKGKFTEVTNIDEIFGTYVVLDGHAGVTKSAEGQVMTKGEVSLAISGTGRGFDLGAALGAFTITPK
jgi:hypothetical protein